MIQAWEEDMTFQMRLSNGTNNDVSLGFRRNDFFQTRLVEERNSVLDLPISKLNKKKRRETPI